MTGFLVILFLAAITGLYIWKRKDKANTTVEKTEGSAINEFDLELQIQQEMQQLEQKRKLKEEENARLEEEARLKRTGAFTLPAPVTPTETSVMTNEADVVDGNIEPVNVDIPVSVISNEATLATQEDDFNDVSLSETAAANDSQIEVVAEAVVSEEFVTPTFESNNLEALSEIDTTVVAVNEKQAEIQESAYNPSSRAISDENETIMNPEVFKNEELPPSTTFSQVLKSGQPKVTAKKTKKATTK